MYHRASLTPHTRPSSQCMTTSVTAAMTPATAPKPTAITRRPPSGACRRVSPSGRIRAGQAGRNAHPADPRRPCAGPPLP
jgi:hypothetical protein